MSEAVTKPKIQPKLNLQEPHLFRVIYVNDEITTVEFVVKSLVDIFNYSDEAALDLARLIHTNGSAIVAVLPYELAEQKGVEVTMLARNNGFPLQVKLEPDV